MNIKVKIGILGLGRIGKLHAATIATHLKDLVDIEAAADPYIRIDQDWAKQNNINKVYTDYMDVINDPQIEAVLICTSTHTHTMLITEAAKAKKHIFCEKPIDFDPEKIREALKHVEGNGVKLQIGFNRRFDHNFKKIKEIIQQDKIGDLHILKITSRDPFPPPLDYVKVSGGIYLDMTIHDYDMARYLTDSEAKEVYATGSIRISPEIAQYNDLDTLVVVMTMKNGVIVVIDNSRQAVHGFDQRVEAFGSKGCATVSNDYPNSAVLYTNNGAYFEKPLHFFHERYADTYIEEIKAFANAIRNNGDTVINGMDGLKPVLIGLAVKKSIETQQAVKVEK